MSERQEFSPSVYKAIVASARGDDGLYRCQCLTCAVEGGRVVVPGKTAQVDHTIPDFLWRHIHKGERPALTKSDGTLLCTQCHARKSAREAALRARMRRATAGQAAHDALMLAKNGTLTEAALAGLLAGLNAMGRKKVSRALVRREHPKVKHIWPSRPMRSNKRVVRSI